MTFLKLTQNRFQDVILLKVLPGVKIHRSSQYEEMVTERESKFCWILLVFDLIYWIFSLRGIRLRVVQATNTFQIRLKNISLTRSRPQLCNQIQL